MWTHRESHDMRPEVALVQDLYVEGITFNNYTAAAAAPV